MIGGLKCAYRDLLRKRRFTRRLDDLTNRQRIRENWPECKRLFRKQEFWMDSASGMEAIAASAVRTASGHAGEPFPRKCPAVQVDDPHRFRSSGDHRRAVCPPEQFDTRTRFCDWLQDAAADGVVQKNVALAPKPPKLVQEEMRCWTAEQAQDFLGRAKGDRLELGGRDSNPQPID